MEEQNRFMSEVFRIVSGALRLDVAKVRNYTAFLADKLDKAGDASSAARLRQLLTETDHELRPAGVSVTRAIPADSESRFPLLEKVTPRMAGEKPIVLSSDQWETVREFVSIAKSHAQLEAQGVSTALSLLLYGPPGCGKTRLARHIAAELGLDLYIGRLDGIVSSYLGSTSKNIRAMFEFASKTPCVLFLDEFDAIAKLRGDTQELGELKRVVNSFIQNLDSVGSQSIVLAATNHESLLDSAVWRRFGYRLHLTYPTDGMRAELLAALLPPISFSEKDTQIIIDLTSGFSGSDMNEAVTRMQRLRITQRRDPDLHDVFRALENVALGEGAERRFLASLKGKTPAAISKTLRLRDPHLYSLSRIGDLLGVSKATAQRLSAKET
jgi:ATP-dependent 26S proteasome regulatory subunit